MNAQDLLRVRVVSMIFDQSLDARETLAAATALGGKPLHFAFLDQRLESGFIEFAEERCERPFVAFYCDRDESYQLAAEVIELLGSEPLAIITHRPERRHGLFRKSGFSEFVERVQQHHSDVQIHVRSRSWQSTPPRIR